jgi:glutathione synthase/RimK-type ligase-like ATP-grasp enzyme
MAEPRVALATAAAWAALNDDDRLLVDALGALGVEAAPAVWDDPTVEWGAHDVVVIRSCWDYFHRADEFRAWIDRLEAAGVALHNPPAVARWNMDKGYLRELEARGVGIVPTAWVERGAGGSLGELLGERGWRAAVVKPRVSASANGTWRTEGGGTDDEARFRDGVAQGALMVQPFVDAVQAEGEWSLIFVDGEFSHAVIKRPAAGDFRVQIEHGGSADPVRPDPGLVAEARAALEAAPGRTLYARVDGCVVDGRFLVMELELLEPHLFLGTAPGAAERLAGAVARKLVDA